MTHWGWQSRIISNKMTALFLLSTAMGQCQAINDDKNLNSLINQITRIVRDRRFKGKVFLAQAVQELEAWLLIDCLGIFCYFASKVARYRENCRDRVSANRSFMRLVSGYQRGDTEKIVEAVIGGKGAKRILERVI